MPWKGQGWSRRWSLYPLSLRHNSAVPGYCTKFPSTFIVSRSLRAQQQRGQSLSYPWQPPWSSLATPPLKEEAVSAVLSGVRVEAVQSVYHCFTWKPNSSTQVTSRLRLPLSLLRAAASTVLFYCLLPLLGDMVCRLWSGESLIEHLL